MLRAYRSVDGRNERLADDAGPADLARACWIDLFGPTPQEVRLVEQAFGLELPTREEMREIELSSRVYREDAGLFLTASVLCRADAKIPEMMDVTFVLTTPAAMPGAAVDAPATGALITLRYDDPKPFYGFHVQAGRQGHRLADGPTAFVLLLDAILDRIADVLEITGHDLNAVARDLMLTDGRSRHVGSEMQSALLKRIARAHDVTAKARESLVTLSRILAFIAVAKEFSGDKGVKARLKTAVQDAQSLADYTAFLSNNIAFQLDALLGLVNIEQNNIVKIFSIAAVAFLPPTLVATVYGMNFEVMPELSWTLGYPLALLLMVLSAVVPYLWFRRRGWL